MFSLKIVALTFAASLVNLAMAAPDSAGIVEMVNGLAYGGIPYGSVTGMVAKYPGFAQAQFGSPRARQLATLKPIRPVIVTPNLRANRLADSQPRAVQIYNLPGVVAPGILGTISQIGY